MTTESYSIIPGMMDFVLWWDDEDNNIENELTTIYYLILYKYQTSKQQLKQPKGIAGA